MSGILCPLVTHNIRASVSTWTHNVSAPVSTCDHPRTQVDTRALTLWGCIIFFFTSSHLSSMYKLYNKVMLSSQDYNKLSQNKPSIAKILLTIWLFYQCQCISFFGITLQLLFYAEYIMSNALVFLQTDLQKPILIDLPFHNIQAHFSLVFQLKFVIFIHFFLYFVILPLKFEIKIFSLSWFHLFS